MICGSPPNHSIVKTLGPRPPRRLRKTLPTSCHSQHHDFKATRLTGSADAKIDVTIGDEANKVKREEKKERPIWMTESTIGDYGETNSSSSRLIASDNMSTDRPPREDIMSLLMTFEKKDGSSGFPLIPGQDLDTIDEIDANGAEVDEMDDDDEDDSNIPTVLVGSQRIPITEIDEDVIEKMTSLEKENYIQVWQDYYVSAFE